MQQQECEVSTQGSPVDPLWKCLLGAGHISPSVCQTTDSPEEIRFFSINNYVVCTNTPGAVSLSYQGTLWELSSQRPAKASLQAGLPAHSHLSTAPSSLLCTAAQPWEYTKETELHSLNGCIACCVNCLSIMLKKSQQGVVFCCFLDIDKLIIKVTWKGKALNSSNNPDKEELSGKKPSLCSYSSNQAVFWWRHRHVH